MDTDGRDPPGNASRHGHAPPMDEPRDSPRCSPRLFPCARLAGAFDPARTAARADKLGPMATLVLLRHGESAWNAEGLFTGWVDVGLSERGAAEAASGGTLLRDTGVLPDLVHRSEQRR